MYIGVPQGGRKSEEKAGISRSCPVFFQDTIFFFSSSFFLSPPEEKLVFFGVASPLPL